MHHIRFWPELRPGPRWGSLQGSPRALSWLVRGYPILLSSTPLVPQTVSRISIKTDLWSPYLCDRSKALCHRGIDRLPNYWQYLISSCLMHLSKVQGCYTAILTEEG